MSRLKFYTKIEILDQSEEKITDVFPSFIKFMSENKKGEWYGIIWVGSKRFLTLDYNGQPPDSLEINVLGSKDSIQRRHPQRKENVVLFSKVLLLKKL
jgi:hypothetical protein